MKVQPTPNREAMDLIMDHDTLTILAANGDRGKSGAADMEASGSRKRLADVLAAAIEVDELRCESDVKGMDRAIWRLHEALAAVRGATHA